MPSITILKLIIFYKKGLEIIYGACLKCLILSFLDLTAIYSRIKKHYYHTNEMYSKGGQKNTRIFRGHVP